MPKYEIIETCTEVRSYYYTIDAVDEDAAKELFYRGKANKEEERIKDCLNAELQIEEL
jgi:hypothetical protein